jgi:hypothetical protein
MIPEELDGHFYFGIDRCVKILTSLEGREEDTSNYELAFLYQPPKAERKSGMQWLMQLVSITRE